MGEGEGEGNDMRVLLHSAPAPFAGRRPLVSDLEELHLV